MSETIKWSNEKIKEELCKMVEKTNQKTFPTHSELNDFFGDSCLSNAIRRHGGTSFWAHQLNMEEKESESKDGYSYELKCRNDIFSILQLESENMIPRYPYDLLVEKCVKIDTKVSNIYNARNGARFFTCNIEKRNQTCDVYVVYLKNDEGKERVLIIPSIVISGKTQLSIGEHKSIYYKYENRWDIIEKYYKFMVECV